MKVGIKVSGPRRRQSLVHLVDAFQQPLQRKPGVEARRSRIAMDVTLRIAGTLRHMHEFLLQEREVGGYLHPARAPL